MENDFGQMIAHAKAVGSGSLYAFFAYRSNNSPDDVSDFISLVLLAAIDFWFEISS